MTTTTDSYESALLNWKSARDRLHQAFQEFTEASQSLNDVRVERFRHPVNPQVRKAVSDEIDEEMLNLSIFRSRVDSVKAALSYSRNTSMALAAINKLPVEVLGTMFSLVQRYCVHDIIIEQLPQPSISQLADVISRVCTHWRKIALNTRELWSHIDLAVNGGHALFERLHDRAKLWLERARGCPHHLHMHEFDNGGDINSYKIELLLGGNLSRVVSAHMWSNSNTPFREHAFLWELLGAKNTYGSDPEIRDISVVSQRKYAESIELPLEYVSWKDYLYERVSVLHLRGVAVPWHSPICHKLTKLQLENLDDFAPSPAQIATILAASPGLRWLTLCEMGLRMGKKSDSDLVPFPIPLNDLEVLNLHTLDDGCLGSVLRLLAPGLKPLRMSIAPESWDHFDGKDVGEFFQRSNVTTLFVNYSVFDSWGPLPLSLCASLEVLAIAYSDFFLSEEEPNIVFTDTSTSTPHKLNICPKLRTMHLLASSLNPELLARVVATHPIKELWLSECSVSGNERESESHGYTEPLNINEVVDLMHETVETVWVVDHHTSDPAYSWACAM
ncbi:hypothetical protein FRC12_000720 [Ceratobasidium sp. 428]|nr:hypothetical protein FRC12_000720 [Ceratobasidium sp. 428]